MEEKATITLSLNAKSKETSVEDVIGFFFHWNTLMNR
jgi:ACT domain-containing protein